jgi:hypothetical protein
MPPREYKAKNAADVSMTFMVDGVRYPFNLADISANMELELYNQSGGLRLLKVINEVTEAPAGFHIAALVFLSRRSQGDQVTFDEVADHMGLASEIEVIVDDDEDVEVEVDRPEAIAAG